jgi:hypothetical protein
MRKEITAAYGHQPDDDAIAEGIEGELTGRNLQS